MIVLKLVPFGIDGAASSNLMEAYPPKIFLFIYGLKYLYYIEILKLVPFWNLTTKIFFCILPKGIIDGVASSNLMEAHPLKIFLFIYGL